MSQVLQPESGLQITTALAYILTARSRETETEPPSHAMPNPLMYRIYETINVRCLEPLNFGTTAMQQITTILSDIGDGLKSVSYFAVTGGNYESLGST